MPALVPTVGYGVGTVDDYFGLAGAYLKVVSNKKTPHAKSVAKAQDENGNELAETKYGTDTIFDIETTYDLVGGTLVTSAVKLGKYTAGAEGVAPLNVAIADGMSVKTSNGSWPQLTVKGVFSETSDISALFDAADGDLPTFTCPAFTIKGAKLAQVIGVTMGATTARCTGSGLSFDGKIEWHTETGATLAGALTGAELKITGEAVEITAAATVTAATPFAAGDIIQKPGSDRKATGYATASWEASKTYPKDA
jgi:hypothetical protein